MVTEAVNHDQARDRSSLDYNPNDPRNLDGKIETIQTWYHQEEITTIQTPWATVVENTYIDGQFIPQNTICKILDTKNNIHLVELSMHENKPQVRIHTLLLKPAG